MLVVSIFGFLAGGVWVGLTLAGTAWLGMELFSNRPAGDAMAITIWGAASSWPLTALPLFLWMGEILFRSRLSQDRSEERRVGKECVSTGRSGLSPDQ